MSPYKVTKPTYKYVAAVDHITSMNGMKNKNESAGVGKIVKSGEVTMWFCGCYNCFASFRTEAEAIEHEHPCRYGNNMLPKFANAEVVAERASGRPAKEKAKFEIMKSDLEYDSDSNPDIDIRESARCSPPTVPRAKKNRSRSNRYLKLVEGLLERNDELKESVDGVRYFLDKHLWMELELDMDTSDEEEELPTKKEIINVLRHKAPVCKEAFESRKMIARALLSLVDDADDANDADDYKMPPTESHLSEEEFVGELLAKPTEVASDGTVV